MIRSLKSPRLTVRLGLDGVLTLLFVTSLAFRVTGREAHEWIGVSFCMLFLVHTAWNWRWYKNIFSGKYSVRRAVSTFTNMSLLVAMIALCVCGVLNSRHIFGLSQFIDGEVVRQIHSFAAYWGLVLVGIHTGLHGEMIMNAMRKIFAPDGVGRGVAILPGLFAAAIAAVGIWASFERAMGSKLFMGFSFDFWNPNNPLILFYACNLAIVGLYGVIVHYIPKGLRLISQTACLRPNS